MFEDWSILKSLAVGVLFIAAVIVNFWPWLVRMFHGINSGAQLESRKPEDVSPPEEA